MLPVGGSVLADCQRGNCLPSFLFLRYSVYTDGRRQVPGSDSIRFKERDLRFLGASGQIPATRTTLRAPCPSLFVPGKTQHRSPVPVAIADRIDIDRAAPGHRCGIQFAFAH